MSIAALPTQSLAELITALSPLARRPRLLAGAARLPVAELTDRMNGRTPWTYSEIAGVAELLGLDVLRLLDAASDGWEVLAS